MLSFYRRYVLLRENHSLLVLFISLCHLLGWRTSITLFKKSIFAFRMTLNNPVNNAVFTEYKVNSLTTFFNSFLLLSSLFSNTNPRKEGHYLKKWSVKKCDDGIDVQNSCFAHKTSCLLWRSLCFTKVTKSVMACRTHVLLIKQIACLFLDAPFVLHVRSCYNHGNLPTELSPRWTLWGPEGILSKSWSWYPIISVIFFQSFERDYIQMFWKLV